MTEIPERAEPNWQPMPDDPDASTVVAMFDANAETWIMAAQGEYQAAAVQAFRNDGSGLQEVIAVEWPGRYNHTDERVTVRLMIHPEDAIGLADVLTHSARWLLRRKEAR